MALNELRDTLIFEVNRWLGVDYRYGGTGRSGFDCSGFVRRIYQDAFERPLPRTTREQMRVGTEVDRDKLQVADLVFFRTPSRTDHVGVYIGGGEFAHASTSSGIMISHLGEAYWSKSYRSARRVLQLPSETPSTTKVHGTVRQTERDVLVPSSSQANRVGW